MQLKKLLSVVMAVAVLTAVIPLGTFTASAEELSGSCGTNVTWSYNTSTCTLKISSAGATGTGSMNDYSVSNNGAYATTTAPWGMYYDTIKKVIVYSGVTHIGSCAFSLCTNVTSITISDSVTSIGSSAFSHCTGLTSVIIPNRVTSIGKNAFSHCIGLTSITVDTNNKTYHAAGNCLIETKKKVLILGCKRSTIPSNGTVTSIGDDAFSDCTGLTSITIPDSVTSIGGRVFYNCTGLTSVTIGNSVTSIGSSAFRGCTGLTSITIPDSVTSIGNYAFEDCAGLTGIIIPDSVTFIGDLAFSGCVGLESITVKIGNSIYHSADNCLIETESKTLIAGCKKSAIPSNGTITSIGSSAFRGCTGLTSITVPNSITTIEQYAFYDCTGLTSITIPDSVTSIGSLAFRGCTGLESIIVTGGNCFYQSSGHCLIETENKALVAGCKNSKIPTDGSVTSISDWAFYGCTGLTSITIPDSVTSIGSSAFSRCTGLTSVTIPDSVTSIGSSAFSRCTGLTSVTIPDSVTSIGNLAFDGCTELTSIIIPRSINTVGNNSIPKDTRIFCYKDSAAESYAKNNKNVYYIISDNGKCGESSEYYILGDKLYIIGTGETDSWKTQGGVPWYDLAAQIKEVIIDEGITKIGTYAFYCLDNLESVICKNEDLEFSRYALNAANENLTVYAQNGALTEYCQNSNIKFADVTPTPELVEVTANSITVKTVSGYEYSKDKEKWQTSGVFNSLSPVTEYNIYARLIKTKDEFPGKISEPLTVTTDKLTVSAPPKPVCIRNTDTEITLKANGLYEYSIDGENWQKSNVFTGLIHKNTYSLYQRVAETETEYASAPSAPLIMQLVKKTVSAPAAPDYQSHTDNSITLAPNELYEFSIDGENWQKSNVFAGLSKNVIYKFYQRVAETDTEYASEPSAPLVIAIPDKPEILEAGYESILVKYVEGFEYCLDDFVWQDSNTFDKLIDNTEYYVYQRLKSVDGEKVYQITSDYTAVTTDNSIAHTHTFGEWSVKTEATCTGTGEEIRICADCGYIETRDINAHGHLHTEIRNAVIATCTENGYTGDTYCVDCGEKIATGENILALGHKYNAATTPPTCTERGYTTYTCENCGDSYIDDYINATGHIVGEWVTDTEKHWHICSACGERFDEANHTESDWITDKEALPDIMGEKHKECTVCGYITERERIPALPTHTPGDINNDGEVDNKDLTRLFQYLSNWNVKVDEAALDVNGDGSVDNKDLTRLFQYLSNWDVKIY